MIDPLDSRVPCSNTPVPPPDSPPIPLRPGDIVMCRFPSDECRRALEKTRPCLILDVTDDEIVLAYGTTRDRHVTRSRELHIVQPDDLAAAGLWKPTRFLGWRTVRLPRDSGRLRHAPNGGAICGRLSRRSRRGLARLRALARPEPALSNLPRGRARSRAVFLGGAIR